MIYTTYVCGGISKQPVKKDQINGFTEVFLYNPTSKVCNASGTVYFENKDSVIIPETIEVMPEASSLLVMPNYSLPIFNDVGFWGLKLECNVTLIPILIQVPNEITNAEVDVEFKGGVTHFLGTQLQSRWHYPNGIWIDWKRSIEKNTAHVSQLYNEMEIYYFLNPGQSDAKVEMLFQFQNLKPIPFNFIIPAKRHFSWCNYEKIPNNQSYAVRVIGSEPITTCAVRYLYGLEGFGQFGINIRAGMPAASIY